MLVGVVGFIGSGKSTAGKHLVNKHGFKPDSFAKTLKDVTSQVFDWPRELLEGDTNESREFREEVDNEWSNMLGFEITPRYTLQLMGTEVFRDGLHPDIWLYSVKKRYEKAGRPKTVITDVRFPNEMQFIRNQGGQILRVVRDIPHWFFHVRDAETMEEAQNYMENVYPNVHASEWRWIRALSDFDYVVYNDNDLSKLKLEVDNFVNFMREGEKYED